MQLIFFTETLIYIYHNTQYHTLATSAVDYGLISWELIIILLEISIDFKLI